QYKLNEIGEKIACHLSYNFDFASSDYRLIKFFDNSLMGKTLTLKISLRTYLNNTLIARMRKFTYVTVINKFLGTWKTIISNDKYYTTD
ncbi:hypothetical protein WH47_03688, partial [Habropoda laboriosa]